MKSIRLRQSGETRQTGNALLFVLIGIVLFAALAYTFSGSSRSTAKISFEDAQLNAQAILSYAEKVSGAVQNISLQNSCLASQISFENPTVAGYANAGSPANPNKCRVFDADGGGMLYREPPAVALDTVAAATAAAVPYAAGGLVGQYFFTGKACVDNVGTGPFATCAADGLDNEELLLVAPWVNAEVCAAINTILGNTAALLQDTGASFDDTRFTGVFADGFAIGAAASTTYQNGCYQSLAGATPGAGYHFYYTLLAR